MAIHEVTQPDGYKYSFRRSDRDKMCIDLAASAAKKMPVVTDDGTTTVLPVIPVRGRLAELMKFFGLDGF